MTGHTHKGDGFGPYPRTCTVCGKPVRITGPAPLVFEWDPRHGHRSWHTACRQPAQPSSQSPQTTKGTEAT